MPTPTKTPIINHWHLRVAKDGPAETIGQWELYNHKTGATAGRFERFEDADRAWAEKWREAYTAAGVTLPPSGASPSNEGDAAQTAEAA